MNVFGLFDIRRALDEDAALAAVEDGFRQFSAGAAQITAVGHLSFASPPGDCHVKAAAITGRDEFVIKVATGFYGNADGGLPSSNGFMAVMSSHTGEVLALLHDEGYLTNQRTAMAGAIAARAIARPDSLTVGVVGAGTQARLQAKLVARVLQIDTTLFWSRRAERAAALAQELGGQSTSLNELCARADLIVTTTPSTQPLVTLDMIRPGTRIVAVGADSPGKQELQTELVARARIVVDSRQQCIDHGEAGWAVRAGLVDSASLIELGSLLRCPAEFSPHEIVVADLTGVAVQDAAIARSVWLRLQAAKGRAAGPIYPLFQ